MLPSRRSLHRVLKLLYPIECPDNKERDKNNEYSKQNEDNMDSELEESYASHSISTSRPLRQAAIKAKEKLSVCMNGGNEEEAKKTWIDILHLIDNLWV